MIKLSAEAQIGSWRLTDISQNYTLTSYMLLILLVVFVTGGFLVDNLNVI